MLSRRVTVFPILASQLSRGGATLFSSALFRFPSDIYCTRPSFQHDDDGNMENRRRHAYGISNHTTSFRPNFGCPHYCVVATAASQRHGIVGVTACERKGHGKSTGACTAP